MCEKLEILRQSTHYTISQNCFENHANKCEILSSEPYVHSKHSIIVSNYEEWLQITFQTSYAV